MHHHRYGDALPCAFNLRIVRRIAVVFVTAASAALLLVGAPASQANVAGDYCQGVFLKPAQTCIHEIEHLFIETEGWSEKGTANCNGVMNTSGTVLAQACDGNGTPPDEVYCLSCNGWVGWAFIHDHSSTNSDKFTGWLNAVW